jgi:hypothetical protein
VSTGLNSLLLSRQSTLVDTTKVDEKEVLMGQATWCHLILSPIFSFLLS